LNLLVPPMNEPNVSRSAGVREILWTLLLAVLWPAAAAVSLSVAVGGRGVSGMGLVLVACGTMAAYGLDRWIDGRHRDDEQLRRVLFLVVVFASVATGVLACRAWWRLQVCAGLGVIAAAYVPLKRVIPKNVLTTTAWTAATATLPFDHRPDLDPAYGASVLAVALIMAANTVLCDLPDYAADRQAGVRGITPRFGPRVGGFAAVVCGVLGAAAAGSVGRWGLAVTALGLALLATRLARQPSRGLFRLLADGLVTVVPGPLALIFR
jgi:4-hydroxybenzoate polyprenyltransferase